MAEAQQETADLEASTSDKIAMLTKDLELAKAVRRNAAISQDARLVDFSCFELEGDPEAFRKIKGFCRAFGIEATNGFQDGENLLHKYCIVASPHGTTEA